MNSFVFREALEPYTVRKAQASKLSDEDQMLNNYSVSATSAKHWIIWDGKNGMWLWNTRL